MDAVPATEKVTLREEKIDHCNTDNNADPPEQETEGEKAKSTSRDPFTRLRLEDHRAPDAQLTSRAFAEWWIERFSRISSPTSSPIWTRQRRNKRVRVDQPWPSGTPIDHPPFDRPAGAGGDVHS